MTRLVALGNANWPGYKLRVDMTEQSALQKPIMKHIKIALTLSDLRKELRKEEPRKEKLRKGTSEQDLG